MLFANGNFGDNAYFDGNKEGMERAGEELGIDVSNVPYAFVGTTTRYYKDCPDILDVYIFEIDISIEKVTFQKEEVNDVKWATKDEILELYNSGKFEATGFFMDALNFERELYYSNV